MPGERVLFVSKPVAPPWNDGSKNLVRDLATQLAEGGRSVTVVGTDTSPALGERVDVARLHGSGAGGFAPRAADNAKVARYLALAPEARADVWHFVFAPNPLSSTVARLAVASRRLRLQRPFVVQTVASAPRTFERPRAVLFGDVIVAQSEHTRRRLVEAGCAPGRVEVVPPCAADPGPVSAERVDAARARHGLGPGPVVLYAGDYEVSTGAATVTAAVPRILAGHRSAQVVFACRQKTPRAAEARAELEARLAALGVDGASPARRVAHLGDVPDMAALLAASAVVVFPVDDLYGKVDLPLVLLEALALGVPTIVASGGPLDELGAGARIPPRDPEALALTTLWTLDARRDAPGPDAEARAVYEARYRPEAVAAAYAALYARRRRG